jgi:hypothetical protein
MHYAIQALDKEAYKLQKPDFYASIPLKKIQLQFYRIPSGVFAGRLNFLWLAGRNETEGEKGVSAVQKQDKKGGGQGKIQATKTSFLWEVSASQVLEKIVCYICAPESVRACENTPIFKASQGSR